jgi:hypothetical protein
VIDQPRRLIPVVHAELAARAVAVGVHRGLGHAEFARDLLGAEVQIDQAKALTLARREAFDPILDLLDRFAHNTNKLATRPTWSLLVMVKTGVDLDPNAASLIEGDRPCPLTMRSAPTR